MATTASQQKRPLILLHKCSECATFALAPMPIVEQQKMDIDRIRLRFTQVLGLSNAKSPSTVPKKAMDEADDDSAYGSNSGQSSPDESPMSRSDSPSPVNDQHPTSISDSLAGVMVSPNRPQNPFRYRSMSESDGNSPLKGILKRGPMVMRSLSQCDEDNSTIRDPNRRHSESPLLSSIHSSNEDGLDHNISESGDDEDGQQRDRSQSSASSGMKKTVRFNDRVQENVFRPNSSILGQRKKNQRKQQRKRKRTNSGDSQTGGSENDTDHDHDQEDQENDQSPEIDTTVEQEKSAAVVDNVVVTSPELPKPVEPVSPEKPGSKSNRKKIQRQSATVLGDNRYSGFVLGPEKNARTVKHRRHSSGDSGLGDDEEEPEVCSNPAPPKKGGKNRRRRTVSCGDAKDSGMDDA